jgi:hypothetical protein
MDARPATSTLFLHEDALARTLAYEQDLQAWRYAELCAGRCDPGRPPYCDVSSFFLIHLVLYLIMGLGVWFGNDNIS